MRLVTSEIKKAMQKFPIYSQDKAKGNAKVIARYFVSNCTWYVLESEKDCDEVFGLADIGQGLEYGYFCMSELESIELTGKLRIGNKILEYPLRVERDLQIEPLEYTLAECMDLYNESFI